MTPRPRALGRHLTATAVVVFVLGALAWHADATPGDDVRKHDQSAKTLTLPEPSSDAAHGADPVPFSPMIVSPDESFVIWLRPAAAETSDEGEDDAGVLGDWLGPTELCWLDLSTDRDQRCFPDREGRFAWPALVADGAVIAFQFQRGRPSGARRDPFLERRAYVVDLPGDAAEREQALSSGAAWRALIGFGFREDYSAGETGLTFDATGRSVLVSIGERRTFLSRKGKHQALYAFSRDGRVQRPVFGGGTRGLESADVFAPRPVLLADEDRPRLLCFVDEEGDGEATLCISAASDEGVGSDGIAETPLRRLLAAGDVADAVTGAFVQCVSTWPRAPIVLCQVGRDNRFSIVAVALPGGDADVALAATPERSYAHPALGPLGLTMACEVWELEPGAADGEPPRVTGVSVDVVDLATGETIKHVPDARFPTIGAGGETLYVLARGVERSAGDDDESAPTIEAWWPVAMPLGLSAEQLGELPEDEQAEIDALVAELANDDPAMREAADYALRGRGRRILDHLIAKRDRLRVSPDADAEVLARLDGIIEYLRRDPLDQPDD